MDNEKSTPDVKLTSDDLAKEYERGYKDAAKFRTSDEHYSSGFRSGVYAVLLTLAFAYCMVLAANYFNHE